MAHTLLLTRGEIHQVERFIKELSTRYVSMPLPTNFSKGDNSPPLRDQLIQIRVSPVQLWDISYPIAQRDAVHTTIFGKDPNHAGKPIHDKYKKFVTAARIGMKLDKMPEYKTDTWLPMSPPQHIELIAIGVKDDYWIEPDGSHSDTANKSKDAFEGI